MWQEYHSVIAIDEVTRLLAEQGTRARIIAGGTDLMLEMERGVRKGIDTLIDITRVNGLNQISLDEDEYIHLGPLVTHADCVSSKLIVERAFPLARACWMVGAPQIRNRGTIAGNIITASPANDTIPPLIGLNARVVLQSVRGVRDIALTEFYTGVRYTVMEPDEMLVDIKFPALKSNQHGTFYKLGLRKVQAISLVDCAVILTIDRDKVTEAAIMLGAVTPIISHAKEAEDYLRGRKLDEGTIQKAAELSQLSSKAISDIRSSRDYRHEMIRVCVERALRTLLHGEEKTDYPERPVLLRSRSMIQNEQNQGLGSLALSMHHIVGNPDPAIETTINGKEYKFTSGYNKTLLRLLREEAGLIGTKEGCDEGECGACTIFLDGAAVMSCLVPAIRAHHADIKTIEGVSKNGKLHPVQQAFIDKGAVQCGYCTPGFIMSSVMLIDEIEKPKASDIKEAISGNLCRCTGYYSIIAAVEQAANSV